jgi:DNA-binding winged helix-turn-helix (wHTH) protein
MARQRIFNSFRLDLVNDQLWAGKGRLDLRRKTFEVLRYLVDRPGQLVTKAALLDAVWADVAISDSMPSICVAELRKVLGDSSRQPSIIETVHGRGYRFIAPLTEAEAPPQAMRSQSSVTEPLIVGREEELAQLQDWFSQASNGTRKVVFVSGEAGIGKTSLVQLFSATVIRSGVTRIGYGQCVEQYGSGEPYMPLLQALTRMSRDSGGEQLIESLRRFAPSWLAQMPTLMAVEERSHLMVEAQGATRLRMLREMADMLGTFTAEVPLVLLFEDLQWSDCSTLELISTIARQGEPARLMVLGTYRPLAMLEPCHPLRATKAELELHRQCVELRLRSLSERDVGNYLNLRFAKAERPKGASLASAIYQRSDGNPLFMVNIVDYLAAQEYAFDVS